jgi:hypothetical protein
MLALFSAARSLRAKAVRPWASAAATGLVVGSAACTILLDHGTSQCQTDADCTKFGGHPTCTSGLCVSSGLQPADCFLGSPQQQQDFLNQCSDIECVKFDNCSRIGLCSADADPPLVSPPALLGDASTPTGGMMDGGAMSSCLDPSEGRSQVVYVTGSSNFPPLLSKLAPLILAAGGPTPVFLVTSSCTGVKSMLSTTPSDHLIRDPALGSSLTKYAAYFGADGRSVPCTLGSGGVEVDVGESDIFSSTCPGFGPPGDQIIDSLGPIQAMAFVVPGASPEMAISAEAAREVFGMGGNGGMAVPWTNPARYFVRNSGTGTQQMVGRAIDVPADRFWGTDQGTASAMDQALKIVTDSNEAKQSIGIISVDWYDNDRGNLKALAFTASGQECAYLPDSKTDATDKRNVRDGHYPIWGPLHFFAASPPSTAAGAFLSVVTVPKPPQAVLDAFIGASLVPTCAMSVQRGTELGPISPYVPSFSCGCYFDSKSKPTGSLPPECTPCDSSNPCPAARPACNFGYCETQ